MNEEQVRRIIREEIREAFSSVEREASNLDYSLRDVAYGVEQIFERVLWRIQDESGERAQQIVPAPEPALVRNPFDEEPND